MTDNFVTIQPRGIVDGMIRPHADGPWLAGGACLAWYKNTAVTTDIDVFFRNKWQQQLVEQRLCSTATAYNCEKVYDSANALTFKLTHKNTPTISYTVQLIVKEYYDNIQQVLAGFDITVCKIGWDGERIHVASTFAEDVRSNSLRFDHINPASHKRLVKYICYGYDLAPGEIEKLIKSDNIDWTIHGTHHYA